MDDIAGSMVFSGSGLLLLDHFVLILHNSNLLKKTGLTYITDRTESCRFLTVRKGPHNSAESNSKLILSMKIILLLIIRILLGKKKLY